jgi:hypothetical protein
MSNNNFDDGIEIPEAAPADFASQQTRKGLSPAVKFGIVIGGVFLVIGGSLLIGGAETSDATSVINVDADLDGTPGGAIQSESPRYQQLLEESNAQAAEDAAREGKTFILTPEKVLQPIDDLEAGRRIEDAVIEPVVVEPAPVAPPRPEPVVVQAPPAPAPAQTARPTPSGAVTAEEQENPYTSAMIGQMGALTPQVRPPSISIQTTGAAGKRAEEEARMAQANVDAAPLGDAEAEGEIIIPAGEVIYAETLTSTNSDLAGSPVLVELTTGEFRGARLIGEFNVNPSSDSMVVSFNTMTLPDGTSVEVSAFAVDGMSAEVAVASDVERRYLKRYGPILASAFITSYAEALAEPEQILTSIGDDTAVVQSPRTEEQSLYAGLGAAAGAIGGDLAANAPKGPKIILRDGWPIAVMFTTPVVAGN